MRITLLRHATIRIEIGGQEAVAGVDAVLLTHTHVDHLDAAGVTAVPSDVVWFTQPEDHAEVVELGFASAQIVPDGEGQDWEGLRIVRTGGRHGREEAAIQALAPVSGFVVSADGEPTVYVAGDTVWCPEVAQAIASRSRPTGRRSPRRASPRAAARAAPAPPRSR